MSPVDKRSTADTKRRILETAKALVEKDPRALSIRELAFETGLSRSTIYRHIGGKESLLTELAEMGSTPPYSGSARERILQAVGRVVGRVGFSSATVEQVADEAGVGVATVYRLYGSKENLLRAFAEKVVPREDVKRLVVEPGEDPEEDLKEIIGSMLDFFYNNRDLARLAFLGNEVEQRYLQELNDGADTALDYLEAFFGHHIQAGRLCSAASPRELALSVIGMVVAYTVLGPLHYGTEPMETHALAERLTRILLRGVDADARGMDS